VYTLTDTHCLIVYNYCCYYYYYYPVNLSRQYLTYSKTRLASVCTAHRTRNCYGRTSSAPATATAELQATCGDIVSCQRFFPTIHIIAIFRWRVCINSDVEDIIYVYVCLCACVCVCVCVQQCKNCSASGYTREHIILVHRQKY